jgi:hypothetical protein
LKSLPSTKLAYAREERFLEIRAAELRHELGGRAGEHQASVLQHRHAVADLLYVGERVRSEKNRAPGVTQAAHLALQQRARLRVEPARGLV